MSELPPEHRGTPQGRCAGCGRVKGSHDRNAGWYELGPRGTVARHRDLLFCPACAAALLVGLDDRMGQSKKNPNLVAVLSGDLQRLKTYLALELATHDANWDARLEVRRWFEWVCNRLPDTGKAEAP